MNRRDFIRGIGRAICVGGTVPFIPSLLLPEEAIEVPRGHWKSTIISTTLSSRTSLIADIENCIARTSGVDEMPVEVICSYDTYKKLLHFHHQRAIQ